MNVVVFKQSNVKNVFIRRYNMTICKAMKDAVEKRVDNGQTIEMLYLKSNKKVINLVF